MRSYPKRRAQSKTGTSYKPTSIPYTVYLQQIRTGKILPVYVLFGAEHPGKEEIVNELKNADKYSVELFQMPETETGRKERISSFLSRVFAQSLWGDKLLLILRNFENLSLTQQKDILTQISTLPVNYFATVVIDCKFSGDSQSLFKEYNNIAVLNFYAPDQRMIIQYISELANNLGLVIDSESAKILLDLIGTDFATINLELEKIKIYLGDKTRITPDIVLVSCGFSKESSVEELTSATFQRNRKSSISNLYRLQKDHEIPVIIVSRLSNTGFQILQIKLGASREDLHVFVNRFKSLLNQSQIWTAKELTNFILELAKIDKKIKTGYPEPYVLLGNLLIRTGKDNGYYYT
jgi:DNA polymerase III delta subunit